MIIDEMQELVEPTETLHERVSAKAKPAAIPLPSQYLGNRIVSHFYPEHWAQVQIARDNARRYGAE